MKPTYMIITFLVLLNFLCFFNTFQLLERLERRIDLQEGKANFIKGGACVIHQEALMDEELAVGMARACYRAQQE